MKRYLLACSLLLVGCGETSGAGTAASSNPGGDVVAMTSFRVASVAALPECNADREGSLAYVTADKKFMACSEGAWAFADIKGATGAAGTDGVDGTNGVDGNSLNVTKVHTCAIDYFNNAPTGILSGAPGAAVVHHNTFGLEVGSHAWRKFEVTITEFSSGVKHASLSVEWSPGYSTDWVIDSRFSAAGTTLKVRGLETKSNRIAVQLAPNSNTLRWVMDDPTGVGGFPVSMAALVESPVRVDSLYWDTPMANVCVTETF